MNDNGRNGLCPHCKRHNGFVMAGRDAWFCCDLHRVRWFVVDPDDLTDERKGEQRRIASYDEVTPVYRAMWHPARLADAQVRLQARALEQSRQEHRRQRLEHERKGEADSDQAT